MDQQFTIDIDHRRGKRNWSERDKRRRDDHRICSGS
jgi:hypothetical protein